MSLIPRTGILLFFLLRATALPAQEAAELDRLNARMARFEAAGLQDSLLQCVPEKARLLRRTDQLAEWIWLQVDFHDLWSDREADALARLDRALAELWRTPATAAESEPLLYLQAYRGYYLSRADRIWPAVQAYEAAAGLYERYRYADYDITELVYKPLGNHYTRLGDNEKALVVFQKGLARLSPDNRGDQAGLYNNIGLAHWNQGEWTLSEAAYRKGLKLPGIPTEKRALLLTGLARTQLDAGRPVEALPTAETALDVLGPRPKQIDYRAYARRVAGMAYSRTGQFERAQRFLSGALADAEKAFGPHSRDVGKTRIALAELQIRRNDPAEALTEANRALMAVLPAFRPLRPDDNPDPSGFYPENTIFEALGIKAEAEEALFRQTGDLRRLESALRCHDLAWQAEAVLRRVFQYRSSKIGLQNAARTREESALRIARQLFDRTGRREYIEQGFSIVERSKAALLLDALQDNLIRQRLAGSDARFDQLTALRQSAAFFERKLLLQPNDSLVAHWRAEYDGLRDRIAALQRRINDDYPALAGLETEGVPPVPVSRSAGLAPGEMLVEYFVSSRSVDIFLAESGKLIAWETVPDNDSLRQLSGRFLKYFENAGAILAAPDDYLQTAFSLWKILLPAAAGSATRLTIVPDGFLNFIPFEALVTVLPGTAVSLRKAEYLVLHREIRYAWSLATLRQQNETSSDAETFLLGVAPLFEHGERGMAPLRSGASEWESVPARALDVLLQEAATVSRFTAVAGRYRVLHLCTHARADVRDTLPPLIELWDAPLSLPDIYALPLHADLVVLSACQTGLGAEQKGEGVMSLARAFAQAGASCILSGLWTVNDRSNAVLLSHFYRHIRAGAPVVAALRQAKLDYLSDDKIPTSAQTPYFWAGMVAVGSDRVLDVPAGGRLLWWCAGALLLLFVAGWWWKKRR